MISFILGLIYFAIALSIIVFVHELGHLVAAKKFGVYCHEFSIGMGPKVKHLFTDKSGTKYNIRAIPIGGYVMLAGEEESEEDKDLDPDQLLVNKKPYQKIIILVAGAFMNFVLAFVLMFLVFFFSGINTETNSNQVEIATSNAESMYPAQAAGLETGDKILSVNGVGTNTYDEIINQLNIDNSDYKIEFQDNETGDINTVVLNKAELSCNVQGIGIAEFYEKDKYNLLDSIKESIKYNYNIVMMSVESLKLLFTGGASVSDLTGPVGIATGSSYVVQAGFTSMIFFIAFLSVSIGFVNLMPFPALDGGRIFIAFGELITRRKLPKKVEDFINMSGILFLLGLMLFVTFSDIYRLSYDDDIVIDLVSKDVSSCVKPNSENEFALSISTIDENNINPNSKYIIEISVSDGNIVSVEDKNINSDKYSVEVTGADLLSNEINDEEFIISPTDNGSGLFEVQVDVKNSLGIVRNTDSEYKEI